MGLRAGISLSPGTGTPKGYTMTDADAIAFVNSIGDIPTLYKQAIDQLVISHKSNNLWTSLKYAIIAPPTMTDTEAFRDLKTNTVLGVAKGSAAAGNKDNLCVGYPNGYMFKAGSSDYIDTGVTFSGLASLTSAAITWKNKYNLAGAAKYDWGVLQSSTQRAFTAVRSVANLAVSDMYKDGTSRISTANSSYNGRYFLNRNANNYLELVKDNSILTTNTVIGAGISLPSINTFIGAYNNLGTPTSYGDNIRTYWAQYTGLSTSDRSIADGIWSAFETAMGRLSTYTKQWILDGNSLSQRNSQRMFRRAMYDLANTASATNNVLIRNYAVPGQTTANMASDYATEAATVYDGTLSQNLYIIWEVTNDLWAGTTVATAKTNLSGLVTAAKATGYTVVVMTPILRDFTGNTGGRSETNWNLDLDTMTQWIKAGSSGADHVVDINNSALWINRSDYASDAAYNAAVAPLVANATYYTDGTHLTNAGYDLVGAKLKAKLATL